MTKVWAVTMMKDEVDVAYQSIRHMLEQDVDGVLVADNLSTDGTRSDLEFIARKFPGRVHVVEDRDPGYYQSKKMTRLAGVAHQQFGADWIIPFDADELWVGTAIPLAKMLRMLVSTNTRVVGLPSYTHVPCGFDAEGETPFHRMTYRRASAGSYPKVAYRYASDLVIHQGNDGIMKSTGEFLAVEILPRDCAIHHYPVRSLEQFVRKMRQGAAALTAAPDLPPTWGQHWRAYGRIFRDCGRPAIESIYWAHFFCPEPHMQGLVYDPIPMPAP
jgi:hypothetical protein